jgi:S-adenosylmethionine:tRNA ribosyltransferase-isomerase
MQLSDLDYALPPDLIAQHPIEPRDAARLLVDRGAGAAPDHRQVRDLVDLLGDGDLLVVNDSKVIPARLAVQRTSGGAVEVLLLEPRDAERRRWEALVRPGGKLKPGEVLLTGEHELVRFDGRAAAGDTFEVTILGDDDPLAVLAEHGRMPLPPYITAPLGEPGRYQTVYAAEPGSAAAPTAGLHLTTELLGRLAAQGVELARVELVVGLDTFQPISVDDPLTHRIHSERYRVPAGVLDRCAAARRVVAVGTTAVRALESAATFGVGEGRTELFIHPGYDWKVVDVLMTNFHLPRTTLLLMIEAFVGRRWRDLYAAAIAERYRFLSFGDAMLLDRGAS